MPTFETLPRFEKDWKNLTPQQLGTFRKVIKDAFVPELMAPDRRFRPGLRVKGVKAHPNVFEMTWDNDGRATFSYGAERVPGQSHVIWLRIGTPDIFTPHRAHDALTMPPQLSIREKPAVPSRAASVPRTLEVRVPSSQPHVSGSPAQPLRSVLPSAVQSVS